LIYVGFIGEEGGGGGCLTGSLSTQGMVPLDSFQGRGHPATGEKVTAHCLSSDHNADVCLSGI